MKIGWMACLLACSCASAGGPQTFPLWPGAAPFARGTAREDVPVLSVHLPDPMPAGRLVAGCVIFPGGGYRVLCDTYEGHDLAAWFNARGMAAFVVKYRLAPKYDGRAMMADARRAFRTVRARAAEWHVDPARLGAIGFSAGGHLAASLATLADDGDAAAADPVARASCRPDFLALVYPYLSMGAALGHEHMRRAFFGGKWTADDLVRFSAAEQVGPRTPRAFVAHARTDQVVNVEHSRRFVAAMRAAGRPVDYVELPRGLHGLGAGKGPDWKAWTDAFEVWLAREGLVGAPAAPQVEEANAANRVGTDHLGRALVSAAEAGPVKPHRQVGLFYYLWLGQHGTQGPYDISKIEAADPKALEKPDSPLWPDPAHAPMLHWGEPLFGYYLSTDEWVLRRHVQLFIDAGIDVLYFDTTNGYHYREVTDKLFAILQEYHDRGFKAPKFCYYMAPARRGSGTSNVLDVWNNYYRDGKFSDLYFRWDGKPLIVTHGDRPYPQRLLDFFTFRRPTWCTPSVPDTWYWGGMPAQNVAVSSAGRREMLPVTVQTPHAGLDAPDARVRGRALGCSEAYWGAPVQGRSWHGGRCDTSPHASEKGLFFQDQIDWALDKAREDVPLAFVCQWNEWIVPFLTRQTGRDMYGFPHWIRLQDEYNLEYSRDIEPMRGGYRDAYYFQLMNFVRRWKGLPAPAKATRRCEPKTAADWRAVSPVYREMTGDVAPRDFPGYDGAGRYVNRTGRNEFQTLRIAVGSDGRIRFLAETVMPLSSPQGPHWMELFVKVPGAPAGLLGYTHRLDAHTPGVTCAAEANRLVYTVDASFLGLDVSKPFSFAFKWSDNRQADDAMDFYVNGDAAPRGRADWLFVYEPR